MKVAVGVAALLLLLLVVVAAAVVLLLLLLASRIAQVLLIWVLICAWLKKEQKPLSLSVL